MKSKKILCLSALVLLLCAFFLPGTAEEMLYSHLGEPLPDFTVETIDGDTFTLSEVLKEKKLVLINFWATWCPYCIQEFPYMQEAYGQYQDQVEILALSVEPTDTPEMLQAYADEYGLTFKVGSDTKTDMGSQFAFMGIPTTLAIDRFGNIAYIKIGSQPSVSAFTRLFSALIGEDYTETRPLTVLPPAAEKTDPDKLQAALSPQGGQITFSNAEESTVWPMVITEKDGRTAAASSNMGEPNTASDLLVQVNAAQGDALAFDFSTSTEPIMDQLIISVDGAPVKRFSGEHDWRAWALSLTPGEHTIRFSYTKNAQADAGEDTVWLSSVRLVSGEEANRLLAALPVYPTWDTPRFELTTEGARRIIFQGDPENRLYAALNCQSSWILPGAEAEILLVPAAGTDPDAAFLYNIYDYSITPLTQALNEEGSAYTLSFPIDTLETTGYPDGAIYFYPSINYESPEEIQGLLLFGGEENADAFLPYVQANIGLEVTWAYAEAAGDGNSAASPAQSSQYTVFFVDHQGNPVPGCIVNFCTDELCIPVVADEQGAAHFTGAPFRYHLQVIRVPEGYTLDPGLEMYTEQRGGEITIVIGKN